MRRSASPVAGRAAVLALGALGALAATACRDPLPEPGQHALSYRLELPGHGDVGEARVGQGDGIVESIDFTLPGGSRHRIGVHAAPDGRPWVRIDRRIGRDRTRVELIRRDDGALEWVRRRGLRIERVAVEAERMDGFVLDPKFPQETDLGALTPFVLLGREALASKDDRHERTVVQLRDGRPTTLRAERRERRRVKVQGESVQASRWFVQTPASGHTVWIDSNGTLLGVDWLFAGLRAVLAGFEWPERVPDPAPGGVKDEGIDELIEEAIAVETSSASLAGTLSMPRDPQRPLPGIVLIHGSGPADRDLSPSLFLRDLAHGLSREGFAVVRYDKRGSGESRITDPSAPVVLQTFADDAAAWLPLLASRPDVDGTCLVPIGHSEGALLAPLLAAGDPRVAAVVALAGGPDNLGSVLPDQLELIARAHDVAPDEIEALRRTQEASFRSLVSPGFSEDRLPESGRPAALWMKSHLEHDSLGVLRQLNVPILALYASGDLQIPPSQADRMRELLPALPKGSDAIVLDGLDHLLMDPHGMPGLGALLDPDRRLDPGVVPRLVRWLRGVPCVSEALGTLGTTEASERLDGAVDPPDGSP